VATRTSPQGVNVDIGTLLRRLLLFDSVVIKSSALQEIPILVRTFGKTGFLQLLHSGVLKISSETLSIITEIHKNGVREQPLFHFTFGRAELADRENYLRKGLVGLQGVHGLKNAERESLIEAILSKRVRPPTGYGEQLQGQIESDIRRNTPVLKAGITEQIKIRLGQSDRPFDVSVEETQSRVFRVVTDLDGVFGLSDDRAHELISPSIALVANLNQRLAEMEAYSAITGFKDSEAPLLFGRLTGILAAQNPKLIEERFTRVLTIADLPECGPFQRIDVDKLLKARESAECREFRVWLSGLGDTTDAQIREMVGGIRNMAASIIQKPLTKTLRFATTTALGLIPGLGPFLGAAAGAADEFLVDRMFPTSGVFAFLTETYPSLFVSA
jgi:hypothetical protein